MRKPAILMSAVATIAQLVPDIAVAQVQAPLSGEAQDASGGVSEIIVTAQKRAESIQDVPLSIQAVTGEAIERAGVNDAVDLGRLLPAAHIYAAFQPSALTIRVRGFGSDPSGATDSDVAAYIDGAFVPRPGAIVSSFLDVAGVELLAGPQGTLFGRNAAMGAMSIRTNEPSVTDSSFKFIAEGGRFDTFSATGVINVPVSENFAMRAAIKGTTTDGPFYNRLDGKRYGKSQTFVGRLSTKWLISDELSWTVRVDGADTDGDGVNPFIVYAETATPTALSNFDRFITRNGGTPAVYDASGDLSYTVNQFMTARPYINDEQWGASSDLTWDVAPNLTARLINSYRDWRSSQQGADTIATSLDLINLLFGWRSKSQSHELQLISSKDAFLDGKLGFTGGLYYFQEDYEVSNQFNLGSQFCGVVLGSVAPPLVPVCNAGPRIGAGRADFSQETDSYAGYLQLNYRILPAVQIDLGVRHTRDRKNGTFVSVVPNVIALGSITRPEGPTPLRFRDNNTSWRASVSWDITDSVMAFATYSTGYKSGGFNAAGTSPALTPATRTFGSQTVEDFELGIKAILFDRAVRFNATFFDTQLSDFQDRSFTGTSFLVRNSGDVASRGVDIDGQVRLSSRLNVNYGVTYLDAKYKTALGAPGLEGCTGTPTCTTVRDLSGERISFAPEWKGSVGFDWRSGPFASGHAMGLAVSENFMSSVLTTNSNNPQSRVSGYATTDVRVSLYTPDDRWQFDLFGSNVFDRRYVTLTLPQVLGAPIGVTDPASGTTLFRGFLGEPARYGLRVTGRF